MTEALTKLRDISIECDNGAAWGTAITVDGEPVDNVMRVEWSVEVDEPAKATLYLQVAPSSLKADGARFLPAPGTKLGTRLRLAWMVLRGAH